MSELLQIQAELIKTQSKSHRAMRVIFDTQEGLSDEVMGRLSSLTEKLGWLCFLPEERKIDTLDVVGLPPLQIDKDEKSPAQRIRACLFVLWEQKGKPTDTFEEFYRQNCEKIISAIKEKLT